LRAIARRRLELESGPSGDACFHAARVLAGARAEPRRHRRTRADGDRGLEAQALAARGPWHAPAHEGSIVEQQPAVALGLARAAPLRAAVRNVATAQASAQPRTSASASPKRGAGVGASQALAESVPMRAACRTRSGAITRSTLQTFWRASARSPTSACSPA